MGTIQTHPPEKEDTINTCEVCGIELTMENMGAGVCMDCTNKGWWMDPVGGIHSPWETDPAAMYE